MLKDRGGTYRDNLDQDLLPLLLQAGLPFLLRWSLDDNTDSQIAASVSCFNAMLVSEQDEVTNEYTKNIDGILAQGIANASSFRCVSLLAVQHSYSEEAYLVLLYYLVCGRSIVLWLVPWERAAMFVSSGDQRS